MIVDVLRLLWHRYASALCVLSKLLRHHGRRLLLHGHQAFLFSTLLLHRVLHVLVGGWILERVHGHLWRGHAVPIGVVPVIRRLCRVGCYVRFCWSQAEWLPELLGWSMCYLLVAGGCMRSMLCQLWCGSPGSNRLLCQLGWICCE